MEAASDIRPPPLGILRSTSRATVGSDQGLGESCESVVGVQPLSGESSRCLASPDASGFLRVAVFAHAYLLGDGSSATVVRDLVRYFRSTNDVDWRIFTVEPSAEALHAGQVPGYGGGAGSSGGDGVWCGTGEVVLGEGVEMPYLNDQGYRFCPGMEARLLEELHAFQPHVLHLTEPCVLSLHALQWARLVKVPVMATHHGEVHAQARALAASAGPPGAILLFMYERYLHNFYCQLPRIFVPTPSLQAELWVGGHGELGATELALWNPAVDADRFSPARRSAALRAALGALEDATTLVLWLGAASAEARPDVWAYVLSALHRDQNPVAGVVVGAGDLAAALRDTVPQVPMTCATDEDVVRAGIDSPDGTFSTLGGRRTSEVLNATESGAPLRACVGDLGEVGVGVSRAPAISAVSAPLEALIASCDVLLCPASADPYHTHLLRAMSCGLAVVADAEAVATLADLGILTAADSVRSVVHSSDIHRDYLRATSDLVLHRELAKQLGRQARRAVLHMCKSGAGAQNGPRPTAGGVGGARNGASVADGCAPLASPLSSPEAAAGGGMGGLWAERNARLVEHYRESVDVGRVRPPRRLRADRALHNLYWLCATRLVAAAARTLHGLRAAQADAIWRRTYAAAAQSVVLLLLPVVLLVGCAAYLPTLLLMQVAWFADVTAPQQRAFAGGPPSSASARTGAGVVAGLARVAREAIFASPGRVPTAVSLPNMLAAASAAGVSSGDLREPRFWRRARRACPCVLACAAAVAVAYVCIVLVLHRHTLRHMWQAHEFWCHDVRGVCERRIPFIVHQMYKNEALPEAWAETPEQWQRMNPGYKYMLWTDAELRSLIAAHYPWFLPVYNAYPNNIQRSDASRYFLLHKYGGIYADLDIVATRSIDRLIAGHEALLPLTPNIGITNAVMASTPGHEFFGFAIRELERYSSAWYHLSRHVTIVSSTGPTFLWSAFLHYTGNNSVALVPPAVWGKCTVCHPQCAEMAGAFFRHLSGGSWHTADSKAINNGILCHPILLMLLGALVASAILRRMLWVPLAAILLLYAFQDWLDVDMWFAPFPWLIGVGKHAPVPPGLAGDGGPDTDSMRMGASSNATLGLFGATGIGRAGAL